MLLYVYSYIPTKMNNFFFYHGDMYIAAMYIHIVIIHIVILHIVSK